MVVVQIVGIRVALFWVYVLDRARRLNDDAFEMIYNIANLTRHGSLGLANEIVEGVVDLYGIDEPITVQFINYLLRLQLEDDATDVAAEIASMADDRPDPIAAIA